MTLEEFMSSGGKPQGTMSLDEFMSSGDKPQGTMSLDEFMGVDVLNGDLSQTDGFSETPPEWQAQMAKLQAGWRDAAQPDPEAEQRATEWWKQKQLAEQVGELPPYATELERITFNRRKELITGEPSDNNLPELQAAYESEVDPQLKQQRLAELQAAERRYRYRKAQLAGEIADLKWTGSTPEQKILEERAAVEAGLGPDMQLADAPIMRGAITGTATAASIPMESVLRNLPGEGAPSALADTLGRLRTAEGQRQGLLDAKQGPVAALPNAIVQMTAEFLPLAAAGVPAAGQVAARGMNDAYLQSDDDAYAIMSGVVQGALTYAGGKLGGGTFIDMLSGKVAGKGISPMLKAWGFGVEQAEELGQLYGQALIDRGYGVGDGRMPTAKEAAWTMATVAGARAVGTAMSANIEDDGVKKPSILDALKNFTDRKWPSRKAAKEAGVDQIATTAKERSELAADIRSRLTAQEFEEQLRAAATSPEEADAVMKIVRARAASADESLDDYVGSRIARIEKTTRDATAQEMGRVLPQGRRGEIDFRTLKDEGLAIIRVFESQNESTILHEFAHLFERDLKGADLRTARSWSGARGGKWTTESREKFARGFERYVATGEAPTRALKRVFEKYKKWLANIYGAIKGTPIDVNLSPEVKQVFDRLLTPTEAKWAGPQQALYADLKAELGEAYSDDEIRQAVSEAFPRPDGYDPNATDDTELVLGQEEDTDQASRSTVVAAAQRQSGRPDSLAQDQPAAIDTPEFKAWFGDWTDPKARTSRAKGPVSFAVNSDGTPKVFYHGTRSSFDKFESGRKTTNSSTFGSWETERHGIFFAEDPKNAAPFTESAGDRSGGNTMPVFLDMKAPLNLTSRASFRDQITDEELESIGINPRWQALGSWEMFDGEDGKRLVEGLKKLEYDGVIFEDQNPDTREDVTSWVVFDPTQIKSAIGNSGKFDPDDPSILAQDEDELTNRPGLAAKNASMDEARAAMDLPAINKPAAPGANMPHHIAEQEAIRQRIPERAAGIVMDYLSDKRKEPLSQLETAGLAVYGDRLNEVYARLAEDVNNLTLDEGERRTKAAEMERIEQDFDLLSRAMRQSGTAQSLAFSQRKHIVGSDYRPLTVESLATAAKGDKLTYNEKRKVKKAVDEHAAAEKKLAAQEAKEAAETKKKREAIKTEAKKLKEKIAKAKLPTNINTTARNLAKQFIAEGVTGRRELIDKVQKALREIFPETQRRQVIDAISGYGDFKQLSKDEVSVRLRDLNGQLQQIGKLKDMSEGKAPAKTGMERRTPSDEERGLIKEVNEAKKAGGYEVTDPAKQLASALSTIKTRLRNQIRDLQAQINSRLKRIKDKKAQPSDEETERLIEERDDLKRQYDEIFGKPELTPEQRLAIAERAVKKSIAEYERRLAAGEYPDAPASKTPLTPELIALREKRDRLRSQYQSGKPVSLDETKRIEAEIKATEKSIADLERRLRDGDYSTRAKRPAPNDPKLKALRERAEALRKRYAETNPNPPWVDKAKERLETLRAHLRNGTLPTTTPRTESRNPAVKALQQQLADARKQLSESEPAQKARLLKTIGELNARLQAGNFSLPEGAPRPISPEIERLQYERDRARRKIRMEINQLRPKTIWGHASEPLNLTRSVITTLDLPPVFRQGAFIATANPVRGATATIEGIKAMTSDFAARKALNEIESRPNAPLYARGKLYLGELNGSVSSREEAYVGSWAEKIPIVRSIVSMSERNYTVFLNRLRADTFDAMVASLSRNGEPTMGEVRAIARFINVATGRGDFGGMEQAMTGLAPIFFSPRYAASRFQLLAGQPMYARDAGRARALIAQEYGKYLAGAGLLIAMAVAAGAELEEDGKLKVGNTRFDIFGGLSQTAKITKIAGGGAWKTVASWFGKEPREYDYAKDEAYAVGRFLRSKFSPGAALAMNLVTGRTVGRDEVTPAQIIYDNSMALSLRDVSKAVEEHGFTKGGALWLTSLFGIGMQTYEED